MRLLIIVAATGAFFSSGIARGNAESDFNQLFGDQIKEVRSTSNLDDDIALCKDLLNLANKSTNEKEMLVVLCTNVYELARRNENGYPVAIDALQLIIDHVPLQQLDAMDKKANLLVRLAARGSSDQKAEAGLELVQLRLAMGNLYAEKDEFVNAASQYRQASAAARRFDPDKIKLTSEKLKSLIQQRTITKRAQSLEELLLRDANNTNAATELTEIYLVDLNQLGKARALASRFSDSDLKLVATHAGDAPASLNESTSLALAQWFAKERPGMSASTRARLLDLSIAHYRQYLSAHAKPDLMRKKAELVVSQLRTTRAGIDLPPSPIPGSTTTRSNPGTPPKSNTRPPITPSPPISTSIYQHQAGVAAVAYSPDGKILATAEGKTIRLLDRRTKRELPPLEGHPSSVGRLRFSNDGRMLAAANGKNVTLWNWNTAESVTWSGASRNVGDMAFTDDGKTLAISEQTIHLIDLSDLSNPQTKFTFEMPTVGKGSYTDGMAMNGDGKKIFASVRLLGRGHETHMFSPGTTTSQKKLGGRAVMALSPNEKLLANCVTFSIMVVRDLATGKQIAKFPGHARYATAVAFSPNGSLLCIAGDNGLIKLYDVQTRKELATFEGHTAKVRSVVFAPDGKEIASGSDDKSVRFWKLK